MGSSGEEYDMEWMEDNCFEYSEETNSDTEANAELENQYYHSKLAKQRNPNVALENFNKVLEIQGEKKGEWGFKALKQIIKILFKEEDYYEMMEKYKELLTYLTLVTKNQSDKVVNSILSCVSVSKNNNLLCLFYETTVDKLKELNNPRLWFKTNTKLGKLYCDLGEFDKLQNIIKELYLASQTNVNNTEIIEQNGSQLLDIFALEIEMFAAQKNYGKLRQVYEKSLNIKSLLPQAMSIATIRECGGKMYLRSGEYSKALVDFYEAFKNYDESGSSRRFSCLKYLLLITMLTKSNINPLDSQDAKQYTNKPEIKPMAELYFAYRNNDINSFKTILKERDSSIFNDPLVWEHVDVLHKNICIAKLLETIKAYKTVKIQFISNVLDVDEQEAENLLVSCILDKVINGKIDQINKVLVINEKERSSKRYNSIGNLSANIGRLQEKILTKFCNSAL
ncbi:COP9 signalosome complex subunit 2-like [Rhodnius prolixus]|uniref:COP9 signalosome complex subunit 2 n=1 Tax=Rhodnius prolixus TaxID=13249 RepID=T1I4K5_RHOPR